MQAVGQACAINGDVHSSCMLVFACCMIAGDSLTCPVYIRNTGNVGVHNITLFNTTYPCTIGPLEPLARSSACLVSVLVGQEAFEQGFVDLGLQGVAASRTDYPVPVQWAGSAIVHLWRFGRMQVSASAEPVVVTSAGK